MEVVPRKRRPYSTLEKLEMKKTLVALAALAATGAFAQVTITGLMDAGPRISNFKGNAITQVVANNTATSNITFLGTEDLGGGLKANIRWELDIVPTQTAAMTQGTAASPDNPNIANYGGNGYSFVGLTSATAGTLNFGTINTGTLDANGIGNPFGTALGSGYKTIAIGATRYQQALEYITPTMEGFSGKYLTAFKDQYQNNGATSSIPVATGQQTTSGRDGISEISLKYSQGPLNVIYSSLVTTSYYAAALGVETSCAKYPTAAKTAVIDADTTGLMGGAGNSCVDGNQYKVSTLAANYKYNNLTGYAWFQTQVADGQTNTVSSTSLATVLATVNRKAKGFAVKYEATPALALMAGYRTIARGDTYTAITGTTSADAQAAAGKNSTTKLIGLGADYALSKLTSVYARYETITDDGILYNTAGVGGTGYTTGQGNGKITNTAVGLRVAF